MKRFVLITGMCALWVTGCAGVAPVQIGQMVGTIAGSIIAPGVGGPVGGFIGLLTGMAVQKKVDQVHEVREHRELSEQLKQGSNAQAKTPEEFREQTGIPTRVWVDEHVQQGRVIAGHFDTRVIP